MHGAWVAGKKKVRWEPFWRAFYSHEEKLYHALMWANQSDVLARASAEEVERAFLRLLDAARTLDIRKQSASYSGFDGESFDRPYDADHEAHAVALLHAAKDLLEQARSHPLMAAEGESEFREALLAGFRLAMSLDYGSAPTQEAFFERVAESNKPLLFLGDAPDRARVMDRIAGRYQIVPGLLSITLPQLTQDERFARFYTRIRHRFGYPDWIFLGVIYDIVLNERVDVSRYANEDRIHELHMWSEDVRIHDALEVGIFTNTPFFESHVDMYLVAFFAGLGVGVPPGTKSDGSVRRLMARHFGILHLDVPHDPIFRISSPSR